MKFQTTIVVLFAFFLATDAIFHWAEKKYEKAKEGVGKLKKKFSAGVQNIVKKVSKGGEALEKVGKNIGEKAKKFGETAAKVGEEVGNAGAEAAQFAEKHKGQIETAVKIGEKVAAVAADNSPSNFYDADNVNSFESAPEENLALDSQQGFDELHDFDNDPDNEAYANEE